MSEVVFKWHSQGAQLSELAKGLQLVEETPAKSLLILACSDNHINIPACSNLLLTINMPVFGGVYPKILDGEEILTTGFLLIGFLDELPVHNFLNISQHQKDSEEIFFEAEIEKQLNLTVQNYLLFHDAFSPSSESFIDILYHCLGDVHIIGGGAGSLDFIPRACIFSNQGVLQDAIQLVALTSPLFLSVAHGWEVLDGPYLVTKANQHVVTTLNYQPAFDVYKQCIELQNGYHFTQDNFFSIAQNFPLGIQGANSEMLVRDPIKTLDKNLECVGNVPTNAMIYILQGNPNTLVHAVENAAKAMCDGAGHFKKNLFIVDCISRYLFLKEDFSAEISAISSSDIQAEYMFGILSLGEITNSQSGAIKLLNKSTVLGSF